MVPHTSTKFKPLFLRTQAGILYTNTDKYRTSYLKSTKMGKHLSSPLRRDFTELHIERVIDLYQSVAIFLKYMLLALLLSLLQYLGLQSVKKKSTMPPLTIPYLDSLDFVPIYLQAHLTSTSRASLLFQLLLGNY